MATQRLIYDIFGDIVLETARLAGRNINFMYGDLIEINDNLAKMSASPKFAANKFPLIWLLLPIKGKKSPANRAIDFIAPVSVVIAQYTGKDYKTPERIEKNFRPMLHRIYDNLIQAIESNTEINLEDGYLKEFNYSDEPFWGRGDKQPFNDYIDAIFLENLEIQIKKTQCYGNNSK